MRINGSAYFGASSFVQQALQQIDEDNPLQKSVLIAANSLNTIDIAGAEVLAQEARRRRRMGGGLYFYRLNQPNYEFLRQGGYTHEIGEGAFFPVMTDVTAALYWTLDPDVCRTCKTRIFKPCTGKLLPDGFRRQRLMLATDGSEFSQAPQEIAIALARSFGVTLDIMTSIPAADEDETARARLALTARAALVAGVDTEQVIRVGKQPVLEVVAAAQEADCNILIVGRRPPRGDLKERLLGDVATQIIARAPCHVLIAGWKATMWQRRILVACDGSPESDHVAGVAGQLARITGTPVTLVTAIAGPGKREAVSAELALIAGRLRVDGIVCAIHVAEGVPDKVIVAAAHELDADLVVVGHHQGLGGGVPEQIVGGLACAVLVVQSGAEAASIDRAVANQA